jgi:hypothetical protein
MRDVSIVAVLPNSLKGVLARETRAPAERALAL